MKTMIITLMVLSALLFVWNQRKNSFDHPQVLKEKVLAGALLVDVRSASEYQQNHIAQAINIPVNQVKQRLADFGRKDLEIIVYCKSGGRSTQAQQILQNHGFQTVYNLGGIGNWPK